MVIYFSKINLLSTELFEVYKNREKYNKVADLLVQVFKTDLEYEKEESVIESDGIHTIRTKYRLFIKSKDNDIVNGIIYKDANIRYKELDVVTNQTKTKTIKTIEDVQFYYDVRNEFVGFHTRNRFGFQEFNEAFSGMINKEMKLLNQDFLFSADLYNDGLDISEIEDGLRKIPNIKKLVFNFKIPNPSDDSLLDELEDSLDGMLEQMKETNANSMSVIFDSNGNVGLNIDSDEIQGNLKRVDRLHSSIPAKRATKFGYVSVKAWGKNGKQYTTEELKPVKKNIDNEAEFIPACKEMISSILYSISGK